MGEYLSKTQFYHRGPASQRDKLVGKHVFSGGKLSIRKFAAVAIALASVLATTGCNLASPVATHIVYPPADGSQADLNIVKARNLVYLTNGTAAALAGSLVNSGLTDATVTIAYTDAAVNEKKSLSISVPAGKKVDLGYNGADFANIALGGKPGEIVTIELSDGGSPVAVNVPVLDGSFDFYQPLVGRLGTAPATEK